MDPISKHLNNTFIIASTIDYQKELLVKYTLKLEKACQGYLSAYLKEDYISPRSKKHVLAACRGEISKCETWIENTKLLLEKLTALSVQHSIKDVHF